MIYSKFGSLLTLVSKTEQASGRVMVQATSDGSADVREYLVADLKADAGLDELNRAIAALPLKVAPKNQSTFKRVAEPLPSRQMPRFGPKSHRRA